MTQVFITRHDCYNIFAAVWVSALVPQLSVLSHEGGRELVACVKHEGPGIDLKPGAHAHRRRRQRRLRARQRHAHALKEAACRAIGLLRLEDGERAILQAHKSAQGRM